MCACLIPLALAACVAADPVGISITGIRPDKAAMLSGVTWGSAKLSDQDCPNIAGKYKGKETLLAQFELRNTWFDNKENLFESYKEIPYRSIVRQKIASPGQRFAPGDSTYISTDSSEFYANSYTLIQQTGSALTISLMGADDVLYQRYKISVLPPHIGCNNGEFVIRRANAVVGAEGALGAASAIEKHFRKLSDGSLEMHIISREWYYSYRKGLMGYDAKGYASGTEPRKSDVVLRFQQAQ